MYPKASAMEKILLTILGMTLLKPSNTLLYPASSSLGLVLSVSVPVLELLPERRLLIDWCFQMGYDLPYQLSSFYNIPIWPGKHTPKNRRRDVDSQQWDVENNWLPFGRYNATLINGKHPSDLSAGELYQSLEDILVGYGFHESCLLRSVCELARHPFDEETGNVLTDIISFILTPSQHEGFTSAELLYREAYEEAERIGFLGQNCAAIYFDCHTDALSSITHTIFPGTK